ncbi:MAG: Signal recognition particle receptor FtsY [Syntrophomonadaceae bacterium]|nr:Signal recognition particle receptor FtsY [Bacillota bacterium]
MGLLGRIGEGLKKTRNNIMDRLQGLLTSKSFDEQFYEELEELLLAADVGVQAAQELVGKLCEQASAKRIQDAEQLTALLKNLILQLLTWETTSIAITQKPTVVLVLGVNGVGKTTTIGKLAGLFRSQGQKVILAAGDTFRAAASEQLEIWAGRAEAEIVRHQPGADPAAVIFDAITAARARNADLVLCDTAGRLHNKSNLMDELKKIYRVAERALPGAPHEVLLVLDATTGQNAIAQARIFHQAVPLTGIVLTKLDGTAKGGIIIAVTRELGIPVKFVGIGEGVDDLQPFNPQEYVTGLFEEPVR